MRAACACEALQAPGVLSTRAAGCPEKASIPSARPTQHNAEIQKCRAYNPVQTCRNAAIITTINRIAIITTVNRTAIHAVHTIQCRQAETQECSPEFAARGATRETREPPAGLSLCLLLLYYIILYYIILYYNYNYNYIICTIHHIML